MKEKIIDPFNYNFYEYNLEISQNEINQVRHFLQNIKPEEINYCLTTFRAIDILNLPLLKNLRSQILEILDSKNLILKENWAQMYLEKGHHHDIHCHRDAAYAGIIYLEKNYEDDQAGTWFYDAYQHSDAYQFPFKEKTLILFPGYFPHYVKPKLKDGYRVTIAFNTVINKLDE